ncbi:MAG: ImmA/IrrE family metallo-endopeptidase [Patescibacteria group bacterium]
MSKVKFINRYNLRVARENMGFNARQVSKSLTTSEKDIVSIWESGDGFPTWSQIKSLAKKYNISELAFFSSKNIQENKIIPDFRIGIKEKETDDVKKLINLVLKRQKWLEDVLKSEKYPQNKLIGSGGGIRSPLVLATFVLKSLGINLEEIKAISGFSSKRKTLSYLIDKAENKGIFVGKTISYHRIEVEKMRGLFVASDYAPFIVLNRADALSAQIFSLIHELAHFFRKSESISNSIDFRDSNKNVNDEERFCNRVAAELLLPKDELREDFYDKNDIERIAELYKMSNIFVFYRLKDLGKIKAGQGNLESQILKETEENLSNWKKNRGKGGNYYNNMRDSNGNLFNKIVTKSYLQNRIGYVEASHLLKFSVEKI